MDNKIKLIEEMYPEEKFLKADGFDNCIIGVAERFGMEPVLAYDRSKVIEKLMEDMS